MNRNLNDDSINIPYFKASIDGFNDINKDRFSQIAPVYMRIQTLK